MSLLAAPASLVGGPEMPVAAGPVAGFPVGTPDSWDVVERAVLQSDGDTTLGAIGMFFFGLYLVYDGFTDWQEMRLMQDTPTEKIRSAAVGRTEITGTGNPIDEPLDRPFGDGDCLVATYEIEEWREDDDGGGHWSTVESGAVVEPFIVDDGTGQMRVEPDENATFEISHEHRLRVRVRPQEETPSDVKRFLHVHADEDVPSSDGISGLLFSEDRRYTEQWIPPGEEMYLLGAAEPTGDASAVQSESLVLTRDAAADEFIISEESEKELVSGRKKSAPGKIAGGLAMSSLTLFYLLVLA